MRASILLACVLLGVLGCASPPGTSVEGLTTMRGAADRGELAFGVPADLVLAISWSETRWTQPTETDAHGMHGAPTLGVTGLRLDLGFDPIALVAARLRVSRETASSRIASDPVFATLAASAVLGELAALRGVESDAGLEAWREVIADYVGLDGRAGERHAEYVLSVLRTGMAGSAATGERIVIHSREIALPDLSVSTAALGDADYGPAIWSAASTANYSSGRSGRSIRYVVIHTTQGGYSGAVSWFRNPAASVSAHYVIRSSDGEVTQMVHHGDTAWHAGNRTYNQESIGIEHEGFVDDPGRWYTDAMYRASAALTRHLCDTYGIPIDRAHIIGHVEVPGASHTDPGGGWDWDRYMGLVRGEPPRPRYDATVGARSIPAEMTSGDRIVAWLEFTNTGGTTWDIDGTRVGTSAPQDHASPFFDAENWVNDHRASGADHSGYGTGATGRFTFMLHAPEVSADTTVTDTFRLVQEGVTWFGPETSISVRVRPRVVTPVDADSDGSASDVDCDDADAARHPGATDTCGDGIDQDCDGSDAPCADAAFRADAGFGTPARDAGMSRGDAAPVTTMRRNAEGCGCAVARPTGAPRGLAALVLLGLAAQAIRLSRRRRHDR